MGIKRSDLSWVAVTDLQKSRALFKDIFGFKERAYSEEYGWTELIPPEGGSVLGLAQKSVESPVQPGQNSVLTFTVDNLETSKKAFESKGIKFVGEEMLVPGHVKIHGFVDIDNNYYQLVEKLD